MEQNKIYEPIRKKAEEWIWYDEHEPKSGYRENVAEHDEFRRKHDRDCVLTGGNLYADTIFSLWLPLRHTIVRINDREEIRKVGNMNSKYDFLRELVKGDNMERLLPTDEPATLKLSTLFEFGMGRENVFILPERWLNSARGMKPYYDYVPKFLKACFPGGEFARCWDGEEAFAEWIVRERFQMFFDGDIARENIMDLSGTGDIDVSLPPDGIEPMERMLDNYIEVLKERRRYFSEEMGEEELNLILELDSRPNRKWEPEDIERTMEELEDILPGLSDLKLRQE